MIKVGDKVKLDIESIKRNGMNDGEEQIERFAYILDHPDEIYTVKSDYADPQVIAQYSLDHPVLGPTSFFEDELIKINN